MTTDGNVYPTQGVLFFLPCLCASAPLRETIRWPDTSLVDPILGLALDLCGRLDFNLALIGRVGGGGDGPVDLFAGREKRDSP